MKAFTHVLHSIVVASLLFFNTSLTQECIAEQDCVADSCLRCNNVSASCKHNNTARTVTCKVNNVSDCRLENCSDCDFCSGVYTLHPLLSSATLTSLCAALSSQPCHFHDVQPQCFLGGNNSLNMEDLQEPEILQPCACYEDPYCVQEILISITMPLMVSPTSTLSMVESPTSMEDSNGSSGDPPYLVVMVTIALVLVLTIAMITTCVCIIGVRYAKRRQESRPRRQPRTSEFEAELNDLNLPVNLLNVIGQGRFGYVYRAEYKGEIVAVKLFTYHNRQSWENEREVYSMESTPHQSIVEYIGSESRGSRHDLQLCTITRYYQLGSLSSFLRRQTVTWKQALMMVHSIVEGMAHLHSETYLNNTGITAEKYAIAHRDVKSANVLVKDASGKCVICDLGLALVLDPSTDVKILANSGQVGTFRYMAPEALDARVNLNDIQSFKQIDIYAMSLIIWEIVSRCSALEAPDAVHPYQAPFEDMVGECPSVELMKDTVVAKKLRPSLPAAWRNHQGLNVMLEAIQECWDEDPEARLTAANVLVRTEELVNCLSQEGEEQRERAQENATELSSACSGGPLSSNNGDGLSANPRAHARVTVSRSLIDDPVSMQAPPPPYYSSYHLSRDGAPLVAHRPRFQSSMPHLDTGTWMEGGRQHPYALPPAYGTRSFRNSVVVEGTATRLQNDTDGRRESNSVRNSLILGESIDVSKCEVVLETLSSTGNLLDADHTRESVADSSHSSDHLNSDSGFQASQPQQSGTTLGEGSDFTPSPSPSASHQSLNEEDSADTLNASPIVAGSN